MSLSIRQHALDSFRKSSIYPVTHKNTLTKVHVYKIIEKMQTKTTKAIYYLLIDTFTPQDDSRSFDIVFSKEAKTFMEQKFMPKMMKIVHDLLLKTDSAKRREEILFLAERTFSGIYLGFKNACSLPNPNAELDSIEEGEYESYLNELTDPLDASDSLENSIFIKTSLDPSECSEELFDQKTAELEYQLIQNQKNLCDCDQNILMVLKEKEPLLLRVSQLEKELEPFQEKIHSKVKLKGTQKQKYDSLIQERAALISQIKNKEKQREELEAKKKQLLISNSLLIKEIKIT